MAKQEGEPPSVPEKKAEPGPPPEEEPLVKLNPWWLLVCSVTVVMVFFGLMANYQFALFLRALGVWLVIDATGSICLRHRSFARYMEPRQIFELFFRAVRLAWGVILVLAVV